MIQKIQTKMNSQQLSNISSPTEINCKMKINYIYEHLIKLGYPKIIDINIKNVLQIQKILSCYFQSTNLRLQLIQWLIAMICPNYREQKWFIMEKDPLNKLIKTLWKIGVMPVNKHTKNLDYKKYIQGMLGYQNAINLIYNMTQLAFQTILLKKAKPDVNFGAFFHDLIQNYQDLVNQNYDLYGITFPSKFINIQQISLSKNQKNQKQNHMEQFQRQYKQFYQSKMIPLLQKEDQILDQIYKNKKNSSLLINQLNKQKQSKQIQQSDLAKFTEKLNKYAKVYNQKYNSLIQKIYNILDHPVTKSKLIPFFNQKINKQVQIKQKNNIKQEINKRSIKISKQFCQKYYKFKRIIRNIKNPKDDKQFMQSRSLLMENILQINEVLNLNF